jgi:hypothetical protein
VWQWTNTAADAHTRAAALKGGSYYWPQVSRVRFTFVKCFLVCDARAAGFVVVFSECAVGAAARQTLTHLDVTRSQRMHWISMCVANLNHISREYFAFPCCAFMQSIEETTPVALLMQTRLTPPTLHELMTNRHLQLALPLLKTFVPRSLSLLTMRLLMAICQNLMSTIWLRLLLLLLLLLSHSPPLVLLLFLLLLSSSLQLFSNLLPLCLLSREKWCRVMLRSDTATPQST